MGKLLTAEEIFAADDLTTEIVEVPEWGGAVKVKALRGDERERYEASNGYVKGDRWVPKGNAAARLVSISVVDDKGQRVFSDDDVVKLGRKSAAGLRRVVQVAQRLAGLTDADMEELEGNSGSGQSESSTSDSRSLSVAPSSNSSQKSQAAS